MGRTRFKRMKKSRSRDDMNKLYISNFYMCDKSAFTFGVPFCNRSRLPSYRAAKLTACLRIFYHFVRFIPDHKFKTRLQNKRKREFYQNKRHKLFSFDYYTCPFHIFRCVYAFWKWDTALHPIHHKRLYTFNFNRYLKS